MKIETLCMSCMEDDSGAAICPKCGSPFEIPVANSLQLRPRTVLREQYLVGRALGHGGFGITYIAWDLGLETRLAVKEYMPNGVAARLAGETRVLPFSEQTKQEYDWGLDRFLEEARVLKRFSTHPNVVSVDTIFRVNGTAYLVMEYLDGMTFEEFLRRRGGTITFETAMRVLLPVMDALSTIHAEGILHCDISPDNIHLSRSGKVKLIDFGAARNALSQKSRNLSVILKEGYAPEEQYRSSGVQGPWTDVYGIAATLYHAITGRIPPPALDRQADDRIASPSQLNLGMNPIAENALMKGLAVRAADRFQSMEDFKAAITCQADSTRPVQNAAKNEAAPSPLEATRVVTPALQNIPPEPPSPPAPQTTVVAPIFAAVPAPTVPNYSPPQFPQESANLAAPETLIMPPPGFNPPPPLSYNPTPAPPPSYQPPASPPPMQTTYSSAPPSYNPPAPPAYNPPPPSYNPPPQGYSQAPPPSYAPPPPTYNPPPPTYNPPPPTYNPPGAAGYAPQPPFPPPGGKRPLPKWLIPAALVGVLLLGGVLAAAYHYGKQILETQPPASTTSSNPAGAAGAAAPNCSDPADQSDECRQQRLAQQTQTPAETQPADTGGQTQQPAQANPAQAQPADQGYASPAAASAPVAAAPVAVAPVGVAPVGVAPVDVAPVGAAPVDAAPAGVKTPGYDSLEAQAEAAIKNSQYPDAEAIAQQAIAMNPNRWQAYNTLAKVQLYFTNEPNEAFKNYKLAIAKGGHASFYVYHDHTTGGFNIYCSGWLNVSRGKASFTADDALHSFPVEQVKEAKHNRVFGRLISTTGKSAHAFHVKTAQGHNFNFGPSSSAPAAEADLIVSILGVE